jgi:hypothetical protein
VTIVAIAASNFRYGGGVERQAQLVVAGACPPPAAGFRADLMALGVRLRQPCHTGVGSRLV